MRSIKKLANFKTLLVPKIAEKTVTENKSAVYFSPRVIDKTRACYPMGSNIIYCCIYELKIFTN